MLISIKMIVIPPSSDHEKYFTGLAEDIWETTITDKKELYDQLISENKTLVITCKLNVEGNGETKFNLHYRFLKTTLYCFVEEVHDNES